MCNAHGKNGECHTYVMRGLDKVMISSPGYVPLYNVRTTYTPRSSYVSRRMYQ